MQMNHFRLSFRRCSLALAVSTLTLLPVNAADSKQPAPREFVQGAVDASQLELKAGQLAQQKANHPAVKQLGQAIVEDHARIKSQLQQLAQEHNVPMNNKLSEEHREEWQELQQASGREFDTAFLQYIIEDHQRDLKMLQSASFENNPELQQLVQRNLPLVQRHLRMAQAASQNLEAARRDDQAAGQPKAQANRDQVAVVEPVEPESQEPVEPVDTEVLGLPTSNTDGTILGVIPAPSRVVEAGADESYIARELADGEVDKGVENVFEADRRAVGVPPTSERERAGSAFAGEQPARDQQPGHRSQGNQQNEQAQVPAEVRQALQKRGWNPQSGNPRRVTVWEAEVNGKKVYATSDGKIYQSTEAQQGNR